MPNEQIADHPLVGTEHVYRPDAEPYDPDKDRTPYALVAGFGMTVRIRAVFADWNGIAGLDMLYVFCMATGMHTHLSPRELTGWEHETTGSLLSKTCMCEAAKGRYSTHLPTCPMWVCDGLPLSQTKCLDKAGHM